MTSDTIALTIATIVGPVVAVVLALIGQARMTRSTEAFQQRLLNQLEEERRKFDSFREEQRRKFDLEIEEERKKFALIREEQRMKFDQGWDRAALDRQEHIVGQLRNIVRAVNPKVQFDSTGVATFPDEQK